MHKNCENYLAFLKDTLTAFNDLKNKQKSV